MNFTDRGLVVGLIYQVSCMDDAISAVQKNNKPRAFANVALIVVVGVVTEIARTAEKIIMGLGNVLGAAFSKKCSLSQGIVLLASGTINGGISLIVSVIAMPIFLIASTYDILSGMSHKLLIKSRDRVCEQLKDPIKRWDAAGMSPSFFPATF